VTPLIVTKTAKTVLNPEVPLIVTFFFEKQNVTNSEKLLYIVSSGEFTPAVLLTKRGTMRYKFI